MDLKQAGPEHSGSDEEEKQMAGKRERNYRGNEYLTVARGVKERHVSLADLCVFHSFPLSFPLTSSSTISLIPSVPIIHKNNSLGKRIEKLMRLGCACFVVLSTC